MKVLSLLQPWASLVATPNPNRCTTSSNGRVPIGIKQYETRCWRPRDTELIKVLQTEGFLIHASLGWEKPQRELINQWPFNEYGYLMPGELPFGKIIGHVKLGEIMTTEYWLDHRFNIEVESSHEELKFGDYSENRFAFHLISPVLFKNPIPAKGALNFWNYDLPVPELIIK